jgi:hypothetical protein
MNKEIGVGIIGHVGQGLQALQSALAFHPQMPTVAIVNGEQVNQNERINNDLERGYVIELVPTAQEPFYLHDYSKRFNTKYRLKFYPDHYEKKKKAKRRMQKKSRRNNRKNSKR